MSVFSEIEESKIFKNEEVLSPEYLPELLPHRENGIKLLARNLLPASKGRKPQNTFLFGSPGVGKTVCTKYVFRELEEFTEKVKTVYINCWYYKSAHAVLSKIAEELNAFVQRRGTSMDEILERLVESCRKMNKGLIICLDEVDQLLGDVFYNLLRLDQYIHNPVGVVFISNNPHVFAKLEPRTRSSLNVEEIEFKSYNIEEMKDILQERVAHAFRSVDEGVVLLCANHAVNNGGDVRVGLECLAKAGRLAENENSNKLTVAHVKKILPSVKPVKPKILEELISDVEKIIVDILNERKKLFSSELYNCYRDKVESPISERAFRDYVNHLAELNMIAIQEKSRGVVGRKRIVSQV